MDGLEDTKSLSLEEWARLVALKANLKHWNIRKGQIAWQYARVRNVKEKNFNTKFFHGMATCRMKKKTMIKLKIGSRVIRGRAISLAIKDHFKDHFSQLNCPEITLSLGSFKMLNHDATTLLESIPNALEIVDALKSCDPGKSPGYDGFNVRFLINSWEVVGDEIISFVETFL